MSRFIVGQNEPPFYIGYGYEALARAEMVVGKSDKMKEYLTLAREQAEQVKDKEEKSWLVADLDTIGSQA